MATTINILDPTTHVEGYPKTRTLKLELQFQVTDPDEDAYLFVSPTDDNPQTGLIADLFDILNFENDFTVLAINGVTVEQLKKLLLPA